MEKITIYEIIDETGVIHSSSDKEEMEIAFHCMTDPEKYDQQEKDLWEIDWTGDLKLVKIINIHK